MISFEDYLERCRKQNPRIRESVVRALHDLKKSHEEVKEGADRAAATGTRFGWQ